MVLDRYRLAAPLGAGAFASVWLAVDERLEREVAVKIIPHQRVIGARFEREAWAAARLSHPAIVTLYEAVAEDGAAYLVSELVRGVTLEEALAAGELSDKDIVAIGVALCDALACAHAEGIVHRDVKPSNILIPAEPPAATPPAKLTDFGVARAIGGDALTATGDVIGTAAYMAPEQAAGRSAGPGADLYALALVLYEGLTGVNPLTSSTAAQRASRLGLHLPPLRRQRRELPRELGRGIDLALRPRPAERGTVIELREALALSLPTMANQPGVVASSWRPRRPGGDEHTAATRQATRRLTAVTHGPPQRHADDSSARPRPPQNPRSLTQRLATTPARAGGPAALTPFARATSAAVGAVLVGWLAAHALAPSPLAPAAAALAAAGLLLAAPRAGYALAAASLTLVAALQGHSGEALVLAIAALLPIAAAPSGEPLWPVAGSAPLLAVIGLGGAWPAIAARASSARTRAVLGMVGWLWLALGSPLADRVLYVLPPTGSLQPGLWSTSAYEAAHRVLGGLVSSGALAPAPLWALAAVMLPKLVSRRSLLLDAGRVAVWSLALLVGTELAIRLAHFGGGSAALHGEVIGAIAAALIALAPSALESWRKTHSEYVEPGVP